MKLLFRELVHDDMDSCVGIIKEIYPNQIEENVSGLVKDFSDILNKSYPSKCMVAIANNSIVAFGCYVRMDDKKYAPNIFYKLTWINVCPRYQGRGIGSKLVFELERLINEECKDNLSVLLETDKPGFYRKMGYESYDRNGGNDVMQKMFHGKDNPRILVGTIFSNVKDYAIRDYFKNVCSFTYKNFDFCAIDNSKDKKYHKKIFKYFSEHKKKSNISKLIVLHTPQMDRHSDVFMVFSSNELRKYFLNGKYDALLYLECDIHPPADIIERLLSYAKPIISAIYFTGDKMTSYPMMADAHHFIYGEPQVYIKTYLEGFFDIEECDKPKEIVSAGLGSVLMHRSVLEKISFRHHPEHIVHSDSTFAQDLFSNGITNMYVPIMCRHENQTWDIQHKMIGK